MDGLLLRNRINNSSAKNQQLQMIVYAYETQITQQETGLGIYLGNIFFVLSVFLFLGDFEKFIEMSQIIQIVAFMIETLKIDIKINSEAFGND